MGYAMSNEKSNDKAAALPHAAVAIALPAVTGMGGMPASAQTATTPVSDFSQGGGARDIDRGAGEAQGFGTGTAPAGYSPYGFAAGHDPAPPRPGDRRRR